MFLKFSARKYKWFCFFVVCGFLLSNFYFFPSIAQAPTLSVLLDTNPLGGGPVPLTGLTMTATVSGTATGTINYYFYCDAANDSSTTVIPGYAYSVLATTATTITTPGGICDSVYNAIGTYLAKVIVERGGIAAEERRTVGVFNPVPAVDLKIRPVGGTTWSDWTIDIDYNTAAEIRWTFSGASSCTMSGDWSGTKTASGQESTGNLTEGKTYIYTLECNTSSGLLSDTVMARVAPPTLFGSLSATPNSGTAPLTGALLTANITGGTAIGTINYTFYCNRSDTGTNITTGYAYKLDGTNLLSLSAPATACNSIYASAGTYTAKVIFERSGVAAEARTTITVASPPPPTISLTADATNIAYGTSTVLRWNVTNATSCTGSGGTSSWIGSKTVPAGNQQTDNLTGPNTYNFTLSCTGPGGTRSASVSITVGSPPLPPQVILSSNNIVGTLTIPNHTSIPLEWAVNISPADECHGTGGAGEWEGSKNRTGGSQNTANLIVPPYNFYYIYTYTITCSNVGGSSSSSLVVRVLPDPPVVILQASPTTVTYNSSTQLTWDAGDNYSTSACTANWVGYDGSLAGSMSVGPLTANRTFSLTCSGPGGQGAASVTVTVGSAPAPVVDLEVRPVGGDWDTNGTNIDFNTGAELRWTVENAITGTTCQASGDWTGARSAAGGTQLTGNLTLSKEYTLTCTSSGGTDSDTVTVGVAGAPLPTATISANPTSVDYNGSTTITWSSTNATRCVASGDWSGTKATSGTSQATNLRTDKAYSITCYNAANDWESDFVSVYVGAPPQNQTTNGTITFENPLQNSDIQAILNSLGALIRMLAIGIAGIMIIISGIIILTSMDDRERLNKGKNMLKWTLIGLAVALASSFIIGLLQELLS